MISIPAIQKRLLTEYERARRSRKEGDPKLTLARLLTATGLQIDRSTLHRKLNGVAPMSLVEAEAISRALGMRLRSSVSLGRAA